MKHIKRRLLALLLVVLQVVSIIPTNSFAQASPISQVQITIDRDQATGMWLSKHYYIVVGTGSDNYKYIHLNEIYESGVVPMNFNPALQTDSNSVHVLLKYFDDNNSWEAQPNDDEIKGNNGTVAVFNLWNTLNATIENGQYSVELQNNSNNTETKYSLIFKSLYDPDDNYKTDDNSVTIGATPGSAIDTTDILGDAYSYGIATLDYYAPGESESSFATQRFHSGGGQLGDTNARSNSDTQYWMLGEWIGDTAKIKGHNAVITLPTEPEDVKNNIDFTASDFTKVYELIYLDKDIIDTTVANMISGTKSSDLYRETTINGADFPETQHLYLDFTSAETGTFYIKVPADSNLEKVIADGGKLHLKVNSGQRIVFNMESSDSVTVAKYMMSLDGGAAIGSDTLVASGDYWHYVESVVFNCPNASKLHVSSSGGVFLAPGADASADGVGGGWMVSKSMTHGCEWHNVNGNIPTYHFDSTVLEAVKHINGQVLTDAALNQKFTFKLYEKVSGQWIEKQSVKNTGSSITFDEITYENEDTHYYKITESQEKVTVGEAEYTPDIVQYYAKVVVTKKESTGNVITYKQETKYYSDEACTIECDTVPVFNNAKEERGGLKIRKKVTENGNETLSDEAKNILKGDYQFTIYTDEDCTQAYPDNEHPTTVTITIGDNGETVTSDEITNLPAGVYWIEETTTNNTKVNPVQSKVSVQVKAGQTADQALAIAEFTNNYAHTQAVLSAKKAANANLNSSKQFQFQLLDADDNVLQTSTAIEIGRAHV